MTRLEFQTLAEARAIDAEVLLTAGRFTGAHYLAGYAVECALKACIAKAFSHEDIPDPKLVQAIYTHDLRKLLEQARTNQQIIFDSPVRLSWSIVEKWSEKTRYALTITQSEASNMLKAVTDPAQGVLPCLKKYW